MKTILYVEDEPDDIIFMQKAFRETFIQNPLQVLTDGAQVLNYLQGNGKYADRLKYPEPSLILLDLNMPKTSGFDVLKWIRSTPNICTIPVIVITSSNMESDIQRASLLGANGYLVKPNKPQKLNEIVKAFKDYWICHDRELLSVA